MSDGRRRGFTLLELLVVIGILSLLLAFLVVLIGWMGEASRRKKTEGLIAILSLGCHGYREATGEFPPVAPYGDSRCLHYALGRELEVITGRGPSGAPTGIRKLPPIVQFRASMLDLPPGQETLSPVDRPPVPVIDAWGRPILYRVPGLKNYSAVDLWSMGGDGLDGPPGSGPALDNVGP